MQQTKFHIEECNNGWLLTINPSDGKNPMEMMKPMFKDIKNMMTEPDEIAQLLESVSNVPQNEKVVFMKFADLLGYMALMVQEDFPNLKKD